jgi:hypothetical protein
VAGKERETEREVGAREDGERLDEDVGDSLIAGKMRVKLVSTVPLSVRSPQIVQCEKVAVDDVQIELIIQLQWVGGFKPQSLG